MENHFGVLEMDWGKMELAMKVIDVTGQLRFTEKIPYAQLVQW